VAPSIALAVVATGGSALLALAGCAPTFTPPEVLSAPTTHQVTGRAELDIPLELSGGTAVRILVTAEGVDVQALLLDAAGNPGPPCDAPNRRLGIETLLLERDAGASTTLRIRGNDHSGASGQVTVEVVGLPVATAGDRRRLEATRAEARACRAFADPEQGESAATEFATAADLHRRNRDALLAGRALLHEAGARHDRLDDWPRTAEVARRAAHQLESVAAPKLHAFALRVEGSTLDAIALSPDTPLDRRAEVVRRARELLTRAADRFDELGRPYDAGYALNYRGVSHHYAGEIDRARADYQSALERFRQAGDAPAQALSLQSLALLSHEDGRLAEAVSEFDVALQVLSEKDDAELYAHTMHNSALPLQSLGRFDEAIARYFEAARILRTLGDRAGEARALQGIGMTLRSMGELQRARPFIQTALDMRMEVGTRREQAASLIALGQIELAEGDIEAAIERQQQAVDLVAAPADRARALLALAQSYLAAERLPEARRSLEEITTLELPPTSRFVATAWTELGTVASRSGNAEAARDAFGRGLSAFRETQSELEEARALHRRAEAMMRAGDLDSVLDDTAAALAAFDRISLRGTQAEQRAAFLAAQRGAAELRIAALLHTADRMQKAGESQKADEQRRAALQTSDSARAHLLFDARRTAAGANPPSPDQVARLNDIYELIAGKRQRRDRLLESAKPDVKTLERLAAEIELLRTEARVLKSGSGAAAAGAPADTQPAPASDASWKFRPDTVAAEYFLGEKRSWLFIVDGGHVIAHELPSRHELDLLARKLHEAWRVPGGGPAGEATARALADVLLGPLAALNIDRELLIVPDGALHIVPMAVLAREALAPKGSGGPDVSIVPSLRLLAAGKDRGTGDPGNGLLTIIADPIYAADDPRIRRSAPPAEAGGTDRASLMARNIATAADLNIANPVALQRLPSARLEARDISAVADPSRTRVLTGEMASLDQLRQLPFDRIDILHFATHAWADSEDPALAAVALSHWDATGRPLEGFLYARDVSRLQMDAALVVLSACETALGREILGEAPVSIAQEFLRAGARSVVATLWKVPDTSTALLMREFYRQLLDERRPPEDALKLAQQHLRAQPRWSDPHYWAGFQLVTTEH
jgi:CHAT domain-containing protein/tetratricopeptide (TPR) repeat protein